MTAPRLASITLCLLLALPATALAKPGHVLPIAEDVTVSAMSRGVGPGDPWSAVIALRDRDGRPVSLANPVVSLTDSAGARYVAKGVRTGEPGHYRTRLPAPPAGTYRVAVEVGPGGHAGPRAERIAGVTRVVAPGPPSGGGTLGGAGWAIPLGAVAAIGLSLLLISARRRGGNAPRASAA